MIKKTCSINECSQIHGARGLCNVHYAQAHKMISEQKTTWLELEGFGMAMPKTIEGSTFMRQFRAKKQGTGEN